MNGESSQGVVLRYSFLAEHKACIDFGTREMKLGGIEVACLCKEVIVSTVKHPIYARVNRIVSLGESVMITVGGVDAIERDVKVVPRRSLRLKCGTIEEKDNMLRLKVSNEDAEAMLLRLGSIVGYISKNN